MVKLYHSFFLNSASAMRIDNYHQLTVAGSIILTFIMEVHYLSKEILRFIDCQVTFVVLIMDIKELLNDFDSILNTFLRALLKSSLIDTENIG